MDYGCRIPLDYIVVSGAGQTSKGSSQDHWETGAYDEALLDAGIENFNVLKYTSVLPLEAKEISFEEGKKFFHHGAVLETIMAQANGVKGEVICAGVGRMWVKRNGKLIGGFAAEFEGNCSDVAAQKHLEEALYAIFERRYGSNRVYEISEMKFNVKSLIVDDAFGTVLVALCFLLYRIPHEE